MADLVCANGEMARVSVSTPNLLINFFLFPGEFFDEF